MKLTLKEFEGQSGIYNEDWYDSLRLQSYPATVTASATERKMMREMMLPPMIDQFLKKYLDSARETIGIGYRLTDRCTMPIAEYDEGAREIDFDQGFALRMVVPKESEGFGSQSMQAFIDNIFRHEWHHSQGLDEATARKRDIDYFRWETHHTEARLKECVGVLNVLQNTTLGIEVDRAYLKDMRVLLPALTNYVMGQMGRGAEGQLMSMVVDNFMRFR